MWFLLVVACSRPPVLTGTVVDVWGKPVGDASVVIEGVVERYRTDAAGHFEVHPSGPVTRVMAGKQGYVKAVVDAPQRAPDADWPPLTFTLFPEPETPGFYGVGPAAYVPLEPARIRLVGTELRHYAGVRDVPEGALSAGPARFVFSSTLRPAELSRMNLHLSRLRYVAHTRVKGILGAVDATVDLWVADADVPFDLTQLPSRDDYLIVPREPLAEGVYAFHAQDVLNEPDERVLQALPKEMQVAFPFEVN